MWIEGDFCEESFVIVRETLCKQIGVEIGGTSFDVVE